MKTAILAALLVIAVPAFAETQSQSTSGSQAIVSPGNIGNPIVNLNTTSPESTRARVDSHGNQAASAATTFINAPSADVCALPGDALSVQVVGGGFGATHGGNVYERCDMRADVINLKVSGMPEPVIRARYCMDERMAEAFARAGQPCTDARPQQVQASAPAQVEPTDPYVRARRGLPPLR